MTELRLVVASSSAFIVQLAPPSCTFTMPAPRWLPRGGAAVAIGSTTAAAVGAIVYSHVSQVEERKVMRAGVERDKERLRYLKKTREEGGK